MGTSSTCENMHKYSLQTKHQFSQQPSFRITYCALSKQMELLQAKQSKETKRLREQMEAEAKAQRDQMDNMMKASMKQAEEDRRAFMQENQALNQRLVEMQESNEGMQQMVESLKQQLQQNQSTQCEVKKLGFFDQVLQVIPVFIPYQGSALCKNKGINVFAHSSNFLSDMSSDL